MMTREESLRNLYQHLGLPINANKTDEKEKRALELFHLMWEVAPTIAQIGPIFVSWVKRTLTYDNDILGDVGALKMILQTEQLARETIHGNNLGPRDRAILQAAKELAQLQESWPSDGWEGAADARANHHRRVREAEKALQNAYNGK